MVIYRLPGTDADFGYGQVDFERPAERVGGEVWKSRRPAGWTWRQVLVGMADRLRGTLLRANEKAEAWTLCAPLLNWLLASIPQNPPFSYRSVYLS